MLLPLTAKTAENDHLEISGIDFKELADKYSTPLYVIDIETVKKQCRLYRQSFNFGSIETKIIYASKAFNCIAMCELVKNEGLGVDVSTGGELYIVLKSGFNPADIFFHGNNKSSMEIEYAIKSKVKTFIIDNMEELEAVDIEAKKQGIIQDIMLRVTPGIHASTHEYIQTGKEKSKFGFNITGSIALEAVKNALSKKNLDLKGIHSHIGSQIFNMEPYDKLIDVQLKFLAEVRKTTGKTLSEINIGGGLGIKYLEQDRPASIEEFSKIVKNAIEKYERKYNIKISRLMLEPGRSIIGSAGIAIYKVGVVKEIPGVHNYISVDGGMSDNIRPILYGAVYSTFIANRMSASVSKEENKSLKKYTIVGKHCESGDILVEDARLPQVTTDDYIMLPAAGAYCYSMSSNYNGQTRPLVAAVEDGRSQIWIDREKYEDLIKNHKNLKQV